MLSTNRQENSSGWEECEVRYELPLRSRSAGSSEGAIRCCCEWAMLVTSYMCSLALASSSVSDLTCCRNSDTNRERGSSLTVGLLVMQDALVAQVSVERFYSRKRSWGQMQASMRQYELPPIDCFRIEVNFESLYGTQVLSPRALPLPPSASTLITCLKVNSDLLISMLSLACFPSVPVSPIRSEPAKSTSSILLERMEEGSKGSQLSIRTLRMEWLRDDCKLRRWAAFIRFLRPARKCAIRSSADWHQYTKRFSTVNCSSLLHLRRSPC